MTTATPSSAAGAFARAQARVRPVDEVARERAASHHDRLTKPPGSLGRVEAAGIRLAAIAGQVPPPVPAPAAVTVFAADHGVHAAGVSRWPQAVTAQMVENFLQGGAAINVIAAQVDATVHVVDVGVATPIRGDHPRFTRAPVGPGTHDLSETAAMSVEQARASLDVGAAQAAALVDSGARCLLTGDMGIGNTTASAAVIAACTGRPAADVTGRGAGADDEMLERKRAVVERAVGRLAPASDPVEVLGEVGGFEIGAIAGYVVGAAAARVPVIVDGVISLAGLVLAAALAPDAVDHVMAGHRSTEPGAAVALSHLGLEPLLDLDLRLGEGTGAALALPVVRAAAAVLRDMATFDAAHVDTSPTGGAPS